MLALGQLAQGFAIAHVTLLVFVLVGSVAFPWCEREDEGESAARLMLKVLCTSGLGAAILGFALFFVGLVGGINPLGICATVVALFAAGCLAWRTSPLRASFWRCRLRMLVRCWNVPLVVVWVAMLLIGSRALIPDATGYSDAIYYHLAYAQDWATAGRLVVDPFLFFPFYANNFVLLFAAWMALGAGFYVQFLSWLTGLIAALAVYAAIESCDTRVRRGWRVAIGLLAVFGVISAPIFLDYSVLGYVDVQIGMTAMLSVVAIQLAFRERRAGWLVVSAILAGFLIGMKASFILILPVYVVAIGWACLALGLRRGLIVAVLAILCAASAPWYARNIVLAGDPIPPTINLALYGSDGLWKSAEWEGVWSDVTTSKSPKAFVELPLRAYLDPASGDFREYGASGLILFLYLPPIFAAGMLLYRRRLDPAFGIPVFILTAFVLYWFATSSLLRYALLLYPILALCVAMVLFYVVDRWPRIAPAAVAVALIAALPSFADTGTVKEFTRNDLLGDLHELLHYRGPNAYLEANDDGWSEAEVAIAWIRAHGGGGRVYVVSDNAFDYYFRRAGVTSIGTWIGPAGYFRLLQALDAGEAVEFLNDLDVRAVFLSPQQLIDPAIGHLLVLQLEKAGYHRISLPEQSRYQLYVRG
jgi:4-amino-4-deoxy-L-arabinose transferase-like glycosyltransferase